MSEPHPAKLGGQHTLWLFRDFIDPDEHDRLLERIRREAKLERWGHAASIPLFAGGDDVVVVVDGNVAVRRSNGDDTVRLTRGDAFGKTPKGRVTTDGSPGPSTDLDVGAVRETTIATIARDRLRELWESDEAKRRASVGRWFSKREVEVPLWPLVGTMPTTRLARLLVHLVENYGEIDENRGRLPTALRARQLAELAGVEKSRATEVWDLFETTGLVSHDSGAVVVEDLSRLRQYALG